MGDTSNVTGNDAVHLHCSRIVKRSGPSLGWGRTVRHVASFSCARVNTPRRQGAIPRHD